MDFEKLKEIIASQLNVNIDKITPDALFEDDLGADSLDLLNVVMAVEDEFGISISDESLVNIRTVEDALEAINKLINE